MNILHRIIRAIVIDMPISQLKKCWTEKVSTTAWCIIKKPFYKDQNSHVIFLVSFILGVKTKCIPRSGFLTTIYSIVSSAVIHRLFCILVTTKIVILHTLYQHAYFVSVVSIYSMKKIFIIVPFSRLRALNNLRNINYLSIL